MCGINGVVAFAGEAPVDRAELVAVRDAMARRGPDGSGVWISSDGRAGLAHRRLAIIDLSESGAQPMSTADGRFHITFNGEIYNYRELRAELAANGAEFRSDSDTEVLLALYARRGEAMVHALRGMFAFAIWDDREKTLFLARDPFGIKPLYYAHDGRALRFASQVKALAGVGTIDASPDPAGHVGFFLFGAVPDPHTMYASIKALPAGATLAVGVHRPAPRIETYFDITQELKRAQEAGGSGVAPDTRELLRHELLDSVRHHMVADVPVGFFLSSGLDSSLVAALAQEAHGGDLRSITLGFEEYRGTRDDEAPMASATARHYGTRHETRWVTRASFQEEFANVLAAMDQPSIDGVNTYFVSKAAAESGMKVALSGLGGDELFGGYPSFQQVPRLARIAGGSRGWRAVGRTLRGVTAPLLSRAASPKFASLLEFAGSFGMAYLLRRALYLPWEVREFMDPGMFQQGWDALDLERRLESTTEGLTRDAQRVSALEMSWYMRNQLLRDADWAGMAHSLEIRVPFVDVGLFRAVAPLLASEHAPTKLDAASAARPALPQELLRRRKTGFSIPVHEWAKPARRAPGSPRPLRNWAHIVYRPHKKLRALALLSDAFGGHGGIALYNRDTLTSLCAMPECGEVVALPRIIGKAVEPLPAKLTYRHDAAQGKWSYVGTLVGLLRADPRFDLVLCCHINLIPLAVLAKLRTGAPLVMFIYGIEAWRPHTLKRALLRRVDRFISISDVTRERFRSWSDVSENKIAIVPNAIHAEWYGPGPRNPALLARYGLEGKTILMTLGRLVSSERYKGFDEVLDAMPGLLAEIPDLVYLIVGDGSDRERLERKADELGISKHVRFTGGVGEQEKADHYRLAHAYVMPSRGEGFGFVLLEAMACGIPAVASSVDGGREAVRNGTIGILVDPSDTEDVKRGIREALQRGSGEPPEGLEFFSFDNFRIRIWKLVRDTLRPDDLDRQAA